MDNWQDLKDMLGVIRYVVLGFILFAIIAVGISSCSACSPKKSTTTKNQTSVESYEDEEETDYTPFEDVRMKEVDSSCFSEVGYASDTETLYVRFKDSGSLYRYDEIPSNIYRSLMNAESIGKYYNSDIKGKYPCTRIYE